MMRFRKTDLCTSLWSLALWSTMNRKAQMYSVHFHRFIVICITLWASTCHGYGSRLRMSLNGPRTIPVPTSSVSNRLDIFLSTELRSSHTRSFVAQICDSGQVEVNGKVQNKGYKLKANDFVTLNEGNLEMPDGDVAIVPEKIDLEILYEDDHILAINKPVGMVVHPAVGSPNGTFVNALLHYLGPSASKQLQNPAPTDAELKNDPQERDETDMDVSANVRPGVVHRLDKGTSGVLLAGKSFQWVSRMSRLFARREVSKVYFAICVGNPGCTTIAKPIGRCAKNRQQMCTYDGPPGKLAVTHVRTLAFDGKLSACLLKIDTGRTHQIRVHMKDRRTPILGDDTYGSADWNKQYRRTDQVRRPLLHSYETKFVHPLTGKEVVITAPIPSDMAKLAEKICTHGRESAAMQLSPSMRSAGVIDAASGLLSCATDLFDRPAALSETALRGYASLESIPYVEDEYEWQAEVLGLDEAAE